jgi:hypothetical protein
MKETGPIRISSYFKNLQLDSEGIWHSLHQEKTSYPAQGNEACFAIEDESFWFRHRNQCIFEMVKNFPPKGEGPIFDIGGGNGFVARGLFDHGWNVVLMEPGNTGAKNAKKRGLPWVICGTAQSAGTKSGTLPAVGLFDVLEHIKDDIKYLRYLRNLLFADGILYLTVPAFQFLWSQEDIEAGHYRRYSLHHLEKKLAQAGFKILYSTYIFQFLALALGILRVLPYHLKISKNRKTKIDKIRETHALKGRLLSNIISFLLDMEIKQIKILNPLTFGGSCLVVAKKHYNAKHT